MQKQIGALWVKEYTKDGEAKKMLSGTIDLGVMGEVDIAIFPNDQKKEAKHPDYRIILGNSNGKGEMKTKPEKTKKEPF
ncbi:MAG: hypothetical protein HZC49_14440 [Nitrospirae bacterium]|nr:hypothetical protein [Nitrospirota bacterium]